MLTLFEVPDEPDLTWIGSGEPFFSESFARKFRVFEPEHFAIQSMAKYFMNKNNPFFEPWVREFPMVGRESVWTASSVLVGTLALEIIMQLSALGSQPFQSSDTAHQLEVKAAIWSSLFLRWDFKGQRADCSTFSAKLAVSTFVGTHKFTWLKQLVFGWSVYFSGKLTTLHFDNLLNFLKFHHR